MTEIDVIKKQLIASLKFFLERGIIFSRGLIWIFNEIVEKFHQFCPKLKKTEVPKNFQGISGTYLKQIQFMREKVFRSFC